jgi:hypothetical protein
MDRRPDPKPRKHNMAWQLYQWWDELVRMRQRHQLRISSAEKGKTNAFSIQLENDMMDVLNLDSQIDELEKRLIVAGQSFGPIWDWITSIKGLGSGKLAIQLLAQIDDVGKFATVSKLGRFCGLAVIDGQAERGTPNYNRRLKALFLGPTLIVDQFIMHHTPLYRELYDDEKDRLQGLYPDPVCSKCGGLAERKGKQWRCSDGCKVTSGFKVKYTPLHLDKMARRKVAKIFLQHLWVIWREYEGLPVTKPWILRPGSGHSNYIAPPRF